MKLENSKEHSKSSKKHESPAVARKNALQPILFLLQYCPSRWSKV